MIPNGFKRALQTPGPAVNYRRPVSLLRPFLCSHRQRCPLKCLSSLRAGKNFCLDFGVSPYKINEVGLALNSTILGNRWVSISHMAYGICSLALTGAILYGLQNHV